MFHNSISFTFKINLLLILQPSKIDFFRNKVSYKKFNLIIFFLLIVAQKSLTFL